MKHFETKHYFFRREFKNLLIESLGDMSLSFAVKPELFIK